MIEATVFRGEHGENSLMSTLGSFSFSDNIETARFYALNPNNKVLHPVAKQPRVLTAVVSIKMPIINTPDDPFLDFSVLAPMFTLTERVELALRFAPYVTETNNWEELFSSDYSSLRDLLEFSPERIDELYMLAFPLLDDKHFIAHLTAAGYDGAIHAGYGENSGEIEYKVFNKNQIKVINTENVRPLSEITPVPLYEVNS
jgi:hypothetical protein